MNQELKSRWVEALRSGRYTKSDWFEAPLRTTDDKFSSAGVLCHVIDPDAWDTDHDLPGVYEFTNEDDDRIYIETDVLPRSVFKLAALSHADDDALADMENDGATFAQLADWIEENL